MKIVLISPIFFDLGIVTLSPLLKREGHEVRLLFVPELIDEGASAFSAKTIDAITRFVGDVGMVGINSFSENHFRMVRLADAMRKVVKAPLVWGGIHATLNPEDCISHADIVCIGEGEKALVELARRMAAKEPLAGIKNLVFPTDARTGEKVPLYPLASIDEALPLDYDIAAHYIVENEGVRKVCEADFNGVFITYSARGCPFKCSYCCSDVIHRLYDGEKVCRQRRIDTVIADLRVIKERFPSCRHLWFNEADFLVGKTKRDLELFSERYKKEIGIPFSIWSNPVAVTEEAVRALKDAGLSGINIGTINGSERVQRLIYKRNASAAVYKAKGAILNAYAVAVEYDFILCNPYEEGEDIVSTIRLLMDLPKPFKTVIYSLTYFPKTELYEMAVRDKKIDNHQVVRGYTKATYKVWRFTGDNAYLNIVASMMRGRARRVAMLGMNFYGLLPEPLLRILISRGVVTASRYIPFNRAIYKAIGDLIMLSYLLSRKISSLKRMLRSSTA